MAACGLEPADAAGMPFLDAWFATRSIAASLSMVSNAKRLELETPVVALKVALVAAVPAAVLGALAAAAEAPAGAAAAPLVGAPLPRWPAAALLLLLWSSWLVYAALFIQGSPGPGFLPSIGGAWAHGAGMGGPPGRRCCGEPPAGVEEG